MPYLNSSDDLQHFVFVAITERCDNGDSEYLQLVTEDLKSLKDACRDMLQMMVESNWTVFIQSLINTIDMPDLLQALQERYADELAELNAPEVVYDKDAGIDHTDKSFSTAVSPCVVFGCTETGNQMVLIHTHGYICRKHVCDGCGGKAFSKTYLKSNGHYLCEACDKTKTNKN